jgi:maltose O-acetyltransferase
MNLIPFSCLRVWLLRIGGVKIGDSCYIGFNVMCDTNFAELISIGNRVTISHNTSIYTHTMSPVKSYLANIYKTSKKVVISDGAWIGANCTILPGVEVGENCMVGSGSVVSKSTNSYSVYAGNPCKKIKELQRPPEKSKN